LLKGLVSAVDVLQSMTRAKKYFAVAIAIVIGGVFLSTGIPEYRASKRLAAEGISVAGKVLDERTVYRTKGRSRYYLTVEFEAGNKETVTKELQVSREIHSAGAAADSVQIHYLADDPSVIQAGPTVEVEWRNAAFGLFFLGCGAFLVVFIKQPINREELADTTAGHVDALCDTNQQYVSADARQFKQVDLSFYDCSQREFEQQGYVFLEDVEVVPSKPNRNFARTFLRVLVNAERTSIATIFHLKPKWILKVLGGKETRVCGLDTQLTDNSFVCTDNAESCNALNNAIAINASHMPACSTVEMIIEAHDERVQAHTVFRADAHPVLMQGSEDVRRSMDLQQRIKAAFRSEAGLSKEELERLAGVKNNPSVNDLHDDLKQQQDQSRREAA